MSSDELAKLGFHFEPAFDHLLELELKSGADISALSSDEASIVRSVIRAKACDAALVSRRNTTVGVMDWPAIRSFCIPFLIPCVHTTILGNPNASASVLSAGDVRILEVCEVTTNEQLGEANLGSLTNTIIRNVEGSTPSFKFPKEDFVNLQKRIELWKIQARLLNQHRGWKLGPTEPGKFRPDFSARSRQASSTS